MDIRDRIFAFVLGDGGIFVHGKLSARTERKNATLDFERSIKQAEYLKWQQSQLNELGFRTHYREKERRVKNAFVDKMYSVATLNTNADSTFTSCRKIAYPNGIRKYYDAWINDEIVDDYALAMWWMDDGCITWGKNSRYIAGVLNCNRSKDEAEFLKTFFEKRLKATVTLNRKRLLYNLRFNHDAFKILVKKICPYMHHSMIYKISLFMGEDCKPITPTSAQHIECLLNSI